MLKEFSLDMGLRQRFNPPGPRNFNERVEREHAYCQQALQTARQAIA